MIHELKTWPYYYHMITGGKKRFELRKDDRKFQPGDFLHLREYVPKEDKYTGDECVVPVYDVIRNTEIFGLVDGYCIITIGNPLTN